MAFLTLQVGQCGNQLGASFFDVLASEYATSDALFYENFPWNPFFRLQSDDRIRPLARSVLIDMEPSVVEAAFHRRASPWSYLRSNCVTQQSGSGNNWAMGFLQHGPRVKADILEVIRRELEATDVFGGFLVLQSMAGGTGSGLGAYLTQTLADVFPKSFLLNKCVWPYRIGEVTVQSYNALLTLSHIVQFSHGIFQTENDSLTEACQRIYRMNRPQFCDMNRCAMRDLAAVLLPSKLRPIDGQKTAERFTPGGWTRTVSDVISTLCPRPRQKLLTTLFVPQLCRQSVDYAVFDWETQTRQMLKCLKTRSPIQHHSFAHFLTLRGRQSLAPDVHLLADDDLFCLGCGQIGVAYSPVPFAGLQKSLSLVLNAESNIRPVTDALVRARQMFRSKAFLHCYAQHGLEAGSFQDCFDFLDDHVIPHYKRTAP